MKNSEVVIEALRNSAALSINISGGKDSQVMLRELTAHQDRPNWGGPMFAQHADLGRAEWFDTPRVVRHQAAESDLPLVISRREKGDLFQRLEDREEKLKGTGKPFWPSSAQRYCTSDLKRGPLQKDLRKYNLVVIAIGVRAEESPNRAKQPELSVEKNITGKAFKEMTPEQALAKWLRQPTGRLALRWYPVFHHSLEDVWRVLGSSTDDIERRRQLYRQGEKKAAMEGWAGHPAYVRGNDRLSCSLCVMASWNDLVNGAKYNPAAARYLRNMEVRSGFTFRQDLSIEDVMIGAGLLPGCPKSVKGGDDLQFGSGKVCSSF